MKRILLYFIISIICFTTSAQNYKLGKTLMKFTDPSRNNRKIPSVIYYPATIAGTNTPKVNDGTKFPVVSFGHGFVMKSTDYKFLADALVPLGYIVIFPSTEQGVPPNHSTFGLDEAFCAKEMVNWGNNPSNFFYNIVANKKAIGGHSMGGGASFLGAKYNPDLDCFFNFSAAETFLEESAIQLSKFTTVPALVITGTDDCVAFPKTNSQKMFENLKSEEKIFVNIKNGTHCQFSNVAGPCALGEVVACSGRNINPISRALQQQTTLSVLIPWLNYYLKEDCTAGTTLKNELANSTQISYIDSAALNCTQVFRVRPNSPIKVSVFPNPATNQITLLMPNTDTEKDIQIFSSDGQLVYNKILPTNQYQLYIELKNWSSGMYLAKIIVEHQIQSIPIIIK